MNYKRISILIASFGYCGLNYNMFTNSKYIFDCEFLKITLGKGKNEFSDTFLGTCFYHLINPKTEKDFVLSMLLGAYSIPKFVGFYGLSKFFVACLGSYFFTILANMPNNSFESYYRSMDDNNNPNILAIPLSLIYIMSNNNAISPLWSMTLLLLIILNILGKIDFPYDLRPVLVLSFFRRFFYKKSAGYLRKNIRNLRINKWKML